MSSAPAIYSIGYEGRKFPDFVGILLEAAVDLVLDVRDWPHSRLADYRKSNIDGNLGDYGIGYHHFQALGNPKPGREAARAGDAAEYRRIFNAQLDTPAAQADLATVRELALGGQCVPALMCYCRHRAHCHIGLIAARLPGLRLVNLGE